MEAELKPCPFCGNKPEKELSGSYIFVVCKTDKCAVSGVSFFLREWNRRAPVKEPSHADGKDHRYCQDGHVCDVPGFPPADRTEPLTQWGPPTTGHQQQRPAPEKPANEYLHECKVCAPFPPKGGDRS